MKSVCKMSDHWDVVIRVWTPSSGPLGACAWRTSCSSGWDQPRGWWVRRCRSGPPKTYTGQIIPLPLHITNRTDHTTAPPHHNLNFTADQINCTQSVPPPYVPWGGRSEPACLDLVPCEPHGWSWLDQRWSLTSDLTYNVHFSTLYLTKPTPWGRVQLLLIFFWLQKHLLHIEKF